MRTWTISGRRVFSTADQALRGDGRVRNVVSPPDLAEDDSVEVIELGPVLDLLEDLKTDMRTIALRGRDGCDGFAEEAANALLRDHGRLDPVETSDG